MIGISLLDLFKRVDVMGDKTHFWKHAWCGDVFLKELCMNLYALETNKNCLIMDRMNIGQILVTSGVTAVLDSLEEGEKVSNFWTDGCGMTMGKAHSRLETLSI